MHSRTRFLCLLFLFLSYATLAEAGVVAVNLRDGGSATEPIYLYDTNGGATQSNFGSRTTGGNMEIESVAYDAVTGILYALHRSDAVPTQAAVTGWDPAGNLISSINLAGDLAAEGFLSGAGADLAVHGGTIAVNLRDGSSEAQPVYLYDANGATTQSNFASRTTGGNMEIESVAFDARTGILYALHRSDIVATQAAVTGWDAAGNVVSNVNLAGDLAAAGFLAGVGADLTVNDGTIAVNLRDGSSETQPVYLYDANGATSQSNFASRTTGGNMEIESVAFDAGTGILYALHRSDDVSTQAAITGWDPDGVVVNSIALAGDLAAAGFLSGAGADLAVYTAIPETSGFALVALLSMVLAGAKTARKAITTKR